MESGSETRKPSDEKVADSSAEAKPATGEQAAAKPATGEQAAPGDPSRRIEELRGSLATLERRLGVRSYAFGAAVVLALAAAAVALVLTLQTQNDSATKDELQAAREQIKQVGRSASNAAEADVQSLSDRLDQIEQRISGLSGDQATTKRELTVVQDDIRELRQQISDLENANVGGTGGTTPGTGANGTLNGGAGTGGGTGGTGGTP
jgi:uncharacterized protein HemX